MCEEREGSDVVCATTRARLEAMRGIGIHDSSRFATAGQGLSLSYDDASTRDRRWKMLITARSR